MRKIDKTLDLASAYKSWLEGLDKSGETHPEYESSKGYYYDVVANLLWVQKGLCAYTEKYLVDVQRFSAENWSADGRFDRFEFAGHLEHYDGTLKPEWGWEWSNLFMVDSDVNTKRKRSRPVHHILKPDEPMYDPLYFLEYSFKEHLFFPNGDRESDLQDKILDEIFTLGLNYQPVVDARTMYLTPIIEDVRLGQKTIETARTELWQFYTAFEMSMRSIFP